MNKNLEKKIITENIILALQKVKQTSPLVYHLTNTVTINDCANITLAIGGSPLMSFCIDEIEEIIGFSSSVVLNIGTMDKSMLQMAVEVGKISNRLKKPIILDPVGVGATKARKNLVNELLKEVNFSVIKGNMAEIKCILDMEIQNRGVDSLEIDENAEEIAKLAAQKYNSVIAITGKVDTIADKNNIVRVFNGNKAMGSVTGTGCMISSLIGTFLGAENSSFTSAIAGVLSMGISGELAGNNFVGTGSLKVSIIDNISKLNEETIIDAIKIDFFK
ncbi:MAG: hydroxyethylthiazole kinase [Cetobacterium sp.]|uniref:hydroxyethylthiazole kinase n=1 Tax=Cetobacterium sp. TaxID=2071632 RepID=UPI003F3ED457